MLRCILILLSLSFIACSGGVKSSEGTTTVVQGQPSDPKINALPLDKCVEIYSKNLESSLVAKKLCSCFMSQASSSFELEAIQRFMEEQWEGLKDDELFGLTALYDACFSSGMTRDTARFEGYTPEISAVLYQTIKSSLEQAGLGAEYDLDVFTECLVQSIQQNYTVGEVISEQIMETPKFQELQDACANKAKYSVE